MWKMRKNEYLPRYLHKSQSKGAPLLVRYELK